MDFNRNNMDAASSPYLRQHARSPVWWQEWSLDALEHARSTGRIVLASVGYSTCHWCHVMAGEAFSDPEIASFLNENYVSIKVDREERPDIDRYLMSYLVALTGRGGWPLNAFLAPDLRPIFAITYAPPRTSRGTAGFLEVISRVREFQAGTPSAIGPFRPAADNPMPVEENALVQRLWSAFDREHAGFGAGQKFPPHTTLLFLLHHAAAGGESESEEMARATLNRMASGGLHDHLQGGFFRYCVDREWRIPHFEKMLYDQALALWEYSAAFKLFGDDAFRLVAQGAARCLHETFEDGGLFISALDADTGHVEGGTYLWSVPEIRAVLTEAEFAGFRKAYDVPDAGDSGGRIHLARVSDRDVRLQEEKLLAARKLRPQPAADRKIVTSWNCLLGAAFVNAWRCLGDARHLESARRIAAGVSALLVRDGELAHSFCGSRLQGSGFLEDHASFLLLLTYLLEEDPSSGFGIRELRRKVESFRAGSGWTESRQPDFMEVEAGNFDHPAPSSPALAEFALLRLAIIEGRGRGAMDYLDPGANDFHNLAAMAANGLFHVVSSPAVEEWGKLPLNTIQVRGSEASDCYRGACTRGLPLTGRGREAGAP